MLIQAGLILLLWRGLQLGFLVISGWVSSMPSSSSIISDDDSDIELFFKCWPAKQTRNGDRSSAAGALLQFQKPLHLPRWGEGYDKLWKVKLKSPPRACFLRIILADCVDSSLIVRRPRAKKKKTDRLTGACSRLSGLRGVDARYRHSPGFVCRQLERGTKHARVLSTRGDPSSYRTYSAIEDIFLQPKVSFTHRESPWTLSDYPRRIYTPRVRRVY